MKYYTGIGSRSTPANVLATMTKIAAAWSGLGFVLRSGHAPGADIAFENGSESSEIYLPWKGFNGSHSQLHTSLPGAFEMAARFHPAWDRLNATARKFHARNMHQVLGQDLCTPSKFVVCWTPGGKLVGGTAQALRVAEHFGVPVYNLGRDGDLEALREYYKEVAHG